MSIVAVRAAKVGWVCSLFALAGSGCSGDSTTIFKPASPEQGAIALPLRTETNGIAYRLRAADFSVTGAQALTLHTDDAPDTLVLRQPLQVGDYQIELLDGWHLERQAGDGFQNVNASLLSPKLQAFSIARDQTTSVAYDFRTEQAVIGFNDGDLSLSIGVQDGELCGTGGKIEQIDDGDPCTIDRCDALAGVVHERAPDAGPSCVLESCPAGQTFSAGVCRLNDGQACTTGTDCVSGVCNSWLPDCDRDGFGNASSTAIQTCGNTPPGKPSCRDGVFVTSQATNDCCDSDANAKPGQTVRFAESLPAACIRSAAADHDWNCNGRNEGAPTRNCSLHGQNDCAAGATSRGNDPLDIVPTPQVDTGDVPDGQILCGVSVGPGTCSFFTDVNPSPMGLTGCAPDKVGFTQLPCN